MVNKKQNQYQEVLNERIKLNWSKVESQVKHNQKKLANNAKDHRKLLWNHLRIESLLEQKIRENLQTTNQFAIIIKAVETDDYSSVQFLKTSDLSVNQTIQQNGVLTSDEEEKTNHQTSTTNHQ